MSSNKPNKIYPYFSNGRFYNYPNEKKPGFLLASIEMLLKTYFIKRHDSKTDLSIWQEANPQVILRSNELIITWIGHATFLIQAGGFNILTDPVFGNVSPLFRRIMPPGIAIKDLPEIDFVIISHNHRDHMDYDSLNYLKNKNSKTVFLVGQGDKFWFDKHSFKNVHENIWWDKLKYISELDKKKTIEFTFLPAYHWTQRAIFDFNKSLWGSWMISVNGKNIYFAGDTAYSGHFKNIAAHFDKIDVAFMPIAPCEPRKHMLRTHISSEEAGKAFLDLNAEHFIPMHWGTYYFGLDRFIDPYNRMLSWWSENNIEQYKKLHFMKFGQQINIAQDTIINQDIKQLPFPSTTLRVNSQDERES